MNSTFLQSLRIMGVGMLGIFVVTIVLIAAMVILTKIFPAGLPCVFVHIYGRHFAHLQDG